MNILRKHILLTIAILFLSLQTQVAVSAEGEQPEGIPYFTEIPESQNSPDEAISDTSIDEKNTPLVVSDRPITPPTSLLANKTSSFIDPWFACTIDDVDGVNDGFCRYSSIQAAADDFLLRGGYGIIMLEPGSFVENVTVNNILQLSGFAGQDPLLPTQITGSLSIISQNGFALHNLNIAGGVLISDSGGSLEINNVAVTNTLGNGIEIQNHSGNISVDTVTITNNNGYGLVIRSNTGSISIRNSTFNNNVTGLNLRANDAIWIDSSEINANQLIGLEIINSVAVLVSNSQISKNQGAGMAGLGIMTNGPITLNSVIANGNAGDGVILVSIGNDINVFSSTFNRNGSFGLKAFWLEYSTLRVSDVHACHNTQGGLFAYGNTKVGSIDVCKDELDDLTVAAFITPQTIRTIILNSSTPSAKFAPDRATRVIFEETTSLQAVISGEILFPATYPADITIQVALINQESMSANPTLNVEWLEPGFAVSAFDASGKSLSEISSFNVCFVNRENYSNPIIAFLAQGSDFWTEIASSADNQHVCATSFETGQFILAESAP